MQANAGVVGQAQLNAGMSSAMGTNSGGGDPHMWSFVWFGVATAFILFVYFGFGGLRGSVAS